MRRNIITEMTTKHPDCDIVLVVSGIEVPTGPLVEATEAVLESKVVGSCRANSNSGVRIMAVESCKSLEMLRSKSFGNERVTKGWPHVKIATDAIAMYLFDIKDMITFETMTEESVVEILDPATMGADTKVVMSGIDLLPICMGNVEIHRVPVSDGVPEPLKVLSKLATKTLLAMAGVTEVPKGFYDGVAETFMISPFEGKLDRYSMTFRGKEGSSSEEFTDLSIEQVFAIYELRNTTTIQ